MSSGSKYIKRSTCRICQKPGLIDFLSFTEMPLAGGFIHQNEFQSEEKYPMTVALCPTCKEVQLLETVPSDVLFRDYRFLASTTKSLADHFRNYAAEMVRRFSLKPDSLVVEFGSNDGVLLKPFMDLGIKAVGVEPATNIAAVATKRGCTVINEFFSPRSAKIIESSYGNADLICANNVFAHIDDMHEIMKGVEMLLKPNGVFVFEVHYLLDLIEKCQYDMIYHEHMMYHSIRPLQWLMETVGLQIFCVERHDIHCGSIRVYASRKSAQQEFRIDQSVHQLIELEDKMGITDIEALKEFSKAVSVRINRLDRMVTDLRNEGKKVVGYGASGRASIHINLSHLTTDKLEYVADASPERCGRFIPGLHNPVVSIEHFRNDRSVDYAVVFAYNYIHEITLKETDFLGRGGRFIVPSPDPIILS